MGAGAYRAPFSPYCPYVGKFTHHNPFLPFGAHLRGNGARGWPLSNDLDRGLVLILPFSSFVISDQRVGIALKIRGPLAEETAKRQKATLKRGDKSPECPKSGERGKSTEQAAKRVKVEKTAVEEMLAEQEHQPELKKVNR